MAKKSPVRKAAVKKATRLKVAGARSAAPKVARERLPGGRPEEQVSSDAARGKYVYCVIRSAEMLKFGSAGIGDNGSEIHTIHHRDLAAVVSDVPLGILD